MKDFRIFLTISFGLLAICSIVNGIVYYFDIVNILFAVIFTVVSVLSAFAEKIIDKIDEMEDE